MGKIALVDNDLLSVSNHRFPNLAILKLSGYYKKQGYDTKLILDWNELKDNQYEKIFLSKVFTHSETPEWVMKLPNLEWGGTGFYFDLAPFLPDEIEHTKPDYYLYEKHVQNMIKAGNKKAKFTFYTDTTISFITRFCIRQCDFCVLRNHTKVEPWSPVKEWYDPSKKYFTFLDDNFLAYKGWKEILNELLNYGKPILFKQGLDLRLMTEEKAEMLNKFKCPERVKFAFDHLADKDMIVKKSKLWSKYHKKESLFFVLVAFDRASKWDEDFWKNDMYEGLERMKILMELKQFPYVMRYEKWKDSPNRNFYTTFASFCNQIQFFYKKSFREFLIFAKREKVLKEMEEKYPDLVKEYFDLKYSDYPYEY